MIFLDKNFITHLNQLRDKFIGRTNKNFKPLVK